MILLIFIPSFSGHYFGFQIEKRDWCMARGFLISPRWLDKSKTSEAKARVASRWAARLEEVAEKLAVDTKCDHRGLKPALILELYAALKRRSSTVLHAFVSFSATSEAAPSQYHSAVPFLVPVSRALPNSI
jgi:hypothetical protein